MFFPLLNGLVRKPFKRFPTATEWARFRKYARRIRNFRYRSTPKTLSPEVRSVMQLYTINEPLLPNLTTLDFLGVEGSFIPFIPSFLSPRIITISFSFETPRCLPKSVIASLITKLPTRCPNLQDINLLGLPRGPMVTAAVSDLIFATNRNALRGFCVDSPLTEAASEVMYKLQNLRRLSVAIEKGNSIPSASLPSLTCLRIVCVDGSDGLQILRRATPGKLESVDFTIESEPVGDFLEAFKGVALSLSIQNTLSAIRLSAGRLWDPNYHILLPFTRLVDLYIQSVCAGSCSRVDDGIVIDLSRAMPKLQSLMLGDEPCHPFTGGVTTKGLVALAHNCPNLSSLRVHFQVAGLSDPSMGFETVRDTRYSASWRGCALTKLEVGWIPVSERSAPMVALTLLRIFPRIESIIFGEGNDKWGEIEDMICRSKQIVDRSSKYHHLTMPRNSSLILLRSQIYDR